MTRLLPKHVLLALLFYSVATSLHFVHNAVFLDEYPNLPAWFSATGVMGALLSVHVVGVLGIGVVALGYRNVGLGLIALYAMLGFDGLAHYWVAPYSSHTIGMNLTILLEVATAAILFAVVISLLCSRWPTRH